MAHQSIRIENIEITESSDEEDCVLIPPAEPILLDKDDDGKL